MTLNNKFLFPLHISFNVLVMTPPDCSVDLSHMILQRANKYSKKENSTQTEECESHDLSHDQCASYDEVSHDQTEGCDTCREDGSLPRSGSGFNSENISNSASTAASLPQTVTPYIPP